ncbi:MAG: hypothetical protein GXY06_06305, partial [Clostridiaceae bacterium]|nr:hypothetical protein [Clostridiaceae bacterium]
MAGLISKCPGCGTIVEIEEGKKRASCPKCSTWVDARDAIVAESSMDVRPMADSESATFSSGGYKASTEQVMQSVSPETPAVKPESPEIMPIEHTLSKPLTSSPKPIADNSYSPERTEIKASGPIEPSINIIPQNSGSPEQSAPDSNSPIPPNTDAPEPDMPFSEFVAELNKPLNAMSNKGPKEPADTSVPVFKPLSAAAAASLQHSASMIRDKRQAMENRIEQDDVYRQASSFLEQGQFVSSEPLFLMMTERYPEDYRAWWGLLRSMTRDLKSNIKPEKASEYFKIACDLAPADLEQEIKQTYMTWLKTIAVNHERDHPSHVADRAPNPSKSSDSPVPMSVGNSNMPRKLIADDADKNSSSSCLMGCLIVPLVIVGFLIAIIIAVITESAVGIMIFFIIVGILIYSTQKKKST